MTRTKGLSVHGALRTGALTNAREQNTDHEQRPGREAGQSRTAPPSSAVRGCSEMPPTVSPGAGPVSRGRGLQSGAAGTICSIYVLSADPPHAAAATALRHTLPRDCLESAACRAPAGRLPPRFPRRSPRPRPPARACRGHVRQRRRSAHPVRRSLPRAPCHIYVLLEHKSRVDHGTPLQLLGYMLNIWRRYVAFRVMLRWLGEVRRKGWKEGWRRGQAGTLLRLMERCFREVPETVRERITAASSSELDAWEEAFAEATTFEEFMARAPRRH